MACGAARFGPSAVRGRRVGVWGRTIVVISIYLPWLSSSRLRSFASSSDSSIGKELKDRVVSLTLSRTGDEGCGHGAGDGSGRRIVWTNACLTFPSGVI